VSKILKNDPKKLEMKKIWFLENRRVKELQRKILKHLQVVNQIVKHSLDIVPLPWL
jgi:hypothetical protein